MPHRWGLKTHHLSGTDMVFDQANGSHVHIRDLIVLDTHLNVVHSDDSSSE